jgi:hypothetical protein
MDMTPLITEPQKDIGIFIADFIHGFLEDVTNRINRLA